MIRPLADQYWELSLEAEPVGATAMGDRRFDHRMPDMSPAAQEAHAERLQRLRGLVAEAEPAGPEEELTQVELLGRIDRDLDQLAVDLDAWNVSHMRGPQVELMQIPEFQPLRDEAEVHAYLARLGQMPRYLEQAADGLRRGIEEGRVCSIWPLRRAVAQLESILSRPAQEWPLAAHLLARPERVGEEVHLAAREEAGRLLEEELRPAFGALLACMRDEVAPRARDEEHPGIMHVEGGPEAYRRLVRVHTSLENSPEEIHETGQREVAALREAIQELGQEALGTRDFAAIQERLRGDLELHYADPESIVREAREAIERAEEKLPEVFGLRPAEACAVHPIPAAEAPDATIGYYRGPSPDGAFPGRYFVNTYAPETRRRFEAEVLAFHEAVPGHHLQISVAQGLGELPSFRRFGGVTSYIEGWALYAEKLADELGLYSGPLDRLGMLFFDAKRACRLVADTGLHALGWSRQRAIDYMLEHSLMAGKALEVEVDRYTVMPGQALSYKLGQLEILRLRRLAREAQGEAFSLPAFHDRVLESGAVSLATLASRVEAWAAPQAV